MRLRRNQQASSGGALIACRVPIHSVIDGDDPHELKEERQNLWGETQRANARISSADGFEADD
jgi:hypothetical protein